MKELTKKVFYCEHCNKHGLSKGSMSRHEKWCNRNPENRRACEYCEHLEEIKVDIPNEYSEDGTRQVKGFRCKLLDKLLYPVMVEKKELPRKYPETFENQEPMPMYCEHKKPLHQYILDEPLF